MKTKYDYFILKPKPFISHHCSYIYQRNPKTLKYKLIRTIKPKQQCAPFFETYISPPAYVNSKYEIKQLYSARYTIKALTKEDLFLTLL